MQFEAGKQHPFADNCPSYERLSEFSDSKKKDQSKGSEPASTGSMNAVDDAKAKETPSFLISFVLSLLGRRRHDITMPVPPRGNIGSPTMVREPTYSAVVRSSPPKASTQVAPTPASPARSPASPPIQLSKSSPRLASGPVATFLASLRRTTHHPAQVRPTPVTKGNFNQRPHERMESVRQPQQAVVANARLEQTVPKSDTPAVCDADADPCICTHALRKVPAADRYRHSSSSGSTHPLRIPHAASPQSILAVDSLKLHRLTHKTNCRPSSRPSEPVVRVHNTQTQTPLQPLLPLATALKQLTPPANGACAGRQYEVAGGPTGQGIMKALAAPSFTVPRVVHSCTFEDE